MSEKKPDNPDLSGAESSDEDEPAFEWMKPAARKDAAGEGTEPAAEDKHAAGGAHTPAETQAVTEPQAGPAPVGSHDVEGAHAASGTHDDASGTPEDAERRPVEEERRPVEGETRPGPVSRVSGEQAAEADEQHHVAAEPHAAAQDHAAAETHAGAETSDPTPTSMLSVRPPEEEIERRAAERDQAAKARPVLPRVLQVVLGIFFPFLVIIGAIRAITTPLFLWVEYHRPGFPPDSYGFSLDDRMTYGSYGVDYLVNFAPARYLADLVGADGKKLFTAGEVSHMADVKSVIATTFLAGSVLLVLAAIIIIYLLRRSNGGVRRALFGGSVFTLMAVLLLGALAFVGWDRFFTDFHQLFFAQGSWTFYLDDALIRLYPNQFWMDAGLVVGSLVLLVSLITLILTWPTRRRRERSARSRNPQAARRAA